MERSKAHDSQRSADGSCHQGKQPGWDRKAGSPFRGEETEPRADGGDAAAKVSSQDWPMWFLVTDPALLGAEGPA